MRVTIRHIGNSKGVLLPKQLIAQAGLVDLKTADIAVENGHIVLRKPAKQYTMDGQRPRRQWLLRMAAPC